MNVVWMTNPSRSRAMPVSGSNPFNVQSTSRSEKRQDGKEFRPIMFARCHGDNLGSHATCKPEAYTSAHGYHGDSARCTSSCNLNSAGEKTPKKLLFCNINQGNTVIDEGEEYTSMAGDHNAEDQFGVITHIVDGVKVTDIIV